MYSIIQKSKLFKSIAFLIIACFLSIFLTSSAQASTKQIIFPVHRDYISKVHWSDTWGAPRSGGRYHQGVDIMGQKMIPLVSPENGYVAWSKRSNSSGSYLDIVGDSGYRYRYVHLNNDSPGTDNASATCQQTFSQKLCNNLSGSRIKEGVRVSAGEVIAYMGDSGNAEWTSPHVHFEIHRPGGVPVNPTPYVNAAKSKVNTKPKEIIISSTQTYPAQISRLYKAYFNRQPDTKGFSYWIKSMNNGEDLESIAQNFTKSSEFYKRYSGLNNAQYVNKLYKHVLGRKSDKKGERYWVQKLNSNAASKSSIVVYFSESKEMQKMYKTEAEINNAWYKYYKKAPSPEKVRQWKKLRENKNLDQAHAIIF